MTVYFITHPDVEIDPAIPVPEWRLSVRGRTRMTAGLRQPWAAGLHEVHCSTEQKAIDGARIFADALHVPVTMAADLGENDRSATGYMPRAAFEALADAFFANPDISVRGWERAVDAQARIVSAVERILAHPPSGPIAIVAHGGVGALLLCHLMGVPISRTQDQPPGAGGYYFAFDAATRALAHGWRLLDA
jgi:broad specificity phosphatase PhoE